MKLNYANQRILITGASAGIGREMALILAGYAPKCLVLVARRAEQLKALQTDLQLKHPQLKVYVCPCDLSDTQAIDDLLGQVSTAIGAVDMLINNAGMGDYHLFEEAEWPKLQKMLRLNIEGLTYLTHKLLPAMVALGRGAILNVSSGFGFFFMPGMAVYAASKNYVTAFSEALRLEMRGTGVVISQACPGPVATEFSQVAQAEAASQNLPAIMRLQAEACAREILEGFARGQGVIIPGKWVRLGTNFLRCLPRGILRLGLLKMRKKMAYQTAQAAAPGLSS